MKRYVCPHLHPVILQYMKLRRKKWKYPINSSSSLLDRSPSVCLWYLEQIIILYTLARPSFHNNSFVPSFGLILFTIFVVHRLHTVLTIAWLFSPIFFILFISYFVLFFLSFGTNITYTYVTVLFLESGNFYAYFMDLYYLYTLLW